MNITYKLVSFTMITYLYLCVQCVYCLYISTVYVIYVVSKKNEIKIDLHICVISKNKNTANNDNSTTMILFVYYRAKETRSWIGLKRDSLKTSDWYWLDGTSALNIPVPLVTTKPYALCMTMKYSSNSYQAMNDYVCSNDTPYICKITSKYFTISLRCKF